MILDGDLQRPWKEGEKRESKIVFIGRHLDETAIRAGLPRLRGVRAIGRERRGDDPGDDLAHRACDEILCSAPM